MGKIGRDYLVPNKKDLDLKNTKGRKGVLKHLIVRHDLERLICEYSKKLGWSQGRVFEEMVLAGIPKFEVNNGFRIAEKRIDENRDKILTEQLNEKSAQIREQKKRDSAKKSNDLAEAYSKKIAHDYNSDDWQSV